MAEIIRAGIKSVPPGQSEAASALGMPYRMILKRIVLPQAMRVVEPRGLVHDLVAGKTNFRVLKTPDTNGPT